SAMKQETALSATALIRPLLEAVSQQYGVCPVRLTQPKRKRNGGLPMEKARQVACYLLRQLGFKVQEIGRIMGYASHCQATKNIRLTMRIMSVDKELEAEVKELEEQLEVMRTRGAERNVY